jgi:rhodanese-related sulfurtransferase
MNSEPTADPMVNLRDVSETVTNVVPGVLLRSEAPADHEVDYLDGYWPPATVVDLRDPAERSDRHPLAYVAEIVDLPILDVSPGELLVTLPRSLGELYAQMLEPPASHRLVTAIEVIASAPTPVLVHCSGGKDRTGVVVALALSLVGAAREEIVADYVRTDLVIDAVVARLTTFLDEVIPTEIKESIPDELMRAPASAVEAVLDRLNDPEGGVRGWFVANGGRPETIDALAARLRSPHVAQ